MYDRVLNSDWIQAGTIEVNFKQSVTPRKREPKLLSSCSEKTKKKKGLTENSDELIIGRSTRSW